MKNSIFKSYSKKILKSEAFISVLVVFVLAIGIIGSSYALYMDVDTDTDYQVVEVGDLSIGFDNGDSTINLPNMTPTENDIALSKTDNIFSFYIYNTGTYTANYDIKLETLDENEVDTKYINYQICKDNSQNCDDVKTLSEIENNIIYKDELVAKKTTDATNPSAYYFLRIWINNNFLETGATKTIKLKVVINATNANGYLDNDNTLAGAILNNSNISINTNNPSFSSETTDENVIYTSQDDYGISYYLRGTQSYNYVNFAGMCFRIVRIEGDGTTKLILEDQDETCSSSMNGNWDIATVPYGYNDGENITKINYLNYAGGMSDALENFQNNKLNSELTKLKPSDWIYDTTTYQDESGSNLLSDRASYYTEGKDFYYGTYIRIQNYKPSLKNKGEKMSTYKTGTTMYVGTLTADEIVLAGANNNSEQKYYLINDYQKNNSKIWWTLSPSNYTASNNLEYAYGIDGNGKIENYGVNNDNISVRPSISIIKGTQINGGNGSIDSPYNIK